MNRRMIPVVATICCLIGGAALQGQDTPRGRLVFDRAHGQQAPPPMLEALAAKLGLELQSSTAPITASVLDGARLLYLRAPSGTFTPAESAAIVDYVKGGGALLLVLDEERRQSLATTRVNDIIVPFGLRLTPDTEYVHNNGAIARAGAINKADRELPFSGGRAVEGGTPFAHQLDRDGNPWHPFAAYTLVDGGGRIVVLGEGMASLYLGVPDGKRLTGDSTNLTPYWGKDSAAFMEDVITWLVP